MTDTAIHSWMSAGPGTTTIPLTAGRYVISSNVAGDDLQVRLGPDVIVRQGPGEFMIDPANDVTIDFGQVARLIALYEVVVTP